MELEMNDLQHDLNNCLRVIKRKVWIPLLGLVIGLLLGIIIQPVAKADEYGACATVYNTSYGEYKQALESVTAMKNYTDIVKSYKVCNRAQLLLGDDNLDIETIQDMIKVDFGEKTYILSIFAYSKNPETSIRVANVVADAFIIEMQNITGTETAKILDQANKSFLNKDGQKEQIIIYLLCTVLGGVLTTGILILSVVFSRKLRFISNCTLGGEIEIIGVIPVIENR